MGNYRDPDYRRLITSAKWKRLRASILTEHPLCADCLASGLYTSATEVHHIEPIEKAIDKVTKAQLCFTRSNLVALCWQCHFKRHRQMGKGTKAENVERTSERMQQIRDKFLT